MHNAWLKKQFKNTISAYYYIVGGYDGDGDERTLFTTTEKIKKGEEIIESTQKLPSEVDVSKTIEKKIYQIFILDNWFDCFCL